MPFIVRATARNTGKQVGLGAQDSLLIEFDAATNGPAMVATPGAVSPTPSQMATSPAAVNALLSFSAPIGTNYTARCATHARTAARVRDTWSRRAGPSTHVVVQRHEGKPH